MQFDLNKLMEDPNFISGIGLLGASSPQMNPLLTAYKMVRQQSGDKQANERHQMEMAQEREKNRIYNIQIETQRRNSELEAARDAEGTNLTRQFMERYGMGGQPASQPAAPIIAPPAKPTNFNGSPEKVAGQHLDPQFAAKALSAALMKDPARRIQVLGEALQGQASETRQQNQEARAAEAAERAARAETRAETAAERAARAEIRSESRFDRLERVAAAREHATGVLRGEKSSSPVAAAKERKLSPTELKREDAATKAVAGKETVDKVISDLRASYSTLANSPGGITDTNRNPLGNLHAGAESSLPGQMIGRALGTKNQSERNTIVMSRPLLLQAIKQATGMTGKELDSNADVQMYLRAATDPTLDLQANLKALDRLQELYGTGLKPAATAPKGLPEGWKIERVQ